MLQRIDAMNLVNFYRNTAFDDRYDANSFIGMILDNNLWSDDEYWKLEADLKKILQHYKNKELDPEIMQGIISNDIFLSGSWRDVDIDAKSECFKLDEYQEDTKPNIFDRFRRIKSLLLAVASGDENFYKIKFFYENCTLESCAKNSKDGAVVKIPLKGNAVLNE